MLTVLKKNVSLVASNLDGEIEKPGFNSWVFHSLAENCSSGRFSLQTKQVLIILFSSWTPRVIKLDIYLFLT